MPDTVIDVENLGKCYLIGHESSDRERYTALRDVIGRSAKGIIRSASDMFHGRQLVIGDEVEEFWALRNVSFGVNRGEVVGIIGRNGAGKSTLLKVLSRITEPSEGTAKIKGRVASLLEVGTGFHPELTGRENIFLNGSILGMTRAEIKSKFDEIVAFADVEKFLDTPVKRYSSGMYVRLAFAVAAHLEPEILVVDEVLAVGDVEFQKKCLGKMRDVAGDGRTVLFVSHNMGAVSSLCGSCIFLDNGTIRASGLTAPIIAKYGQSTGASSSYVASDDSSKELVITSASVCANEQDRNGVALSIKIIVGAQKAMNASFIIRLKDAVGTPIGFASLGELEPSRMLSFSRGENEMEIHVQLCELNEGNYIISLDLTMPNIRYIQRLEDCLSFELTRSIGMLGTRVPKQSWGFGSLYFHSTIASQAC
ncbi:ABC transporter ATP-binding protein [bacterium]|nr:ABC transporter ATP-binding protein [bacterium]